MRDWATTVPFVDFRRIVGWIGQSLISVGVLILLFVAYQLWGTNLAEARSQRGLKDNIEAALGPGGIGKPGLDPSQVPPPAPEGDAIAIIKIPKISVEKAVVEGVGVPELKKGPGHYPKTPLPGQPGNSAIAGHRTTYGAPFYRLDEMVNGDKIFVTTRQGRFEYRVTEKKVVLPKAVEVLDNTEDNRLTLTTCEPRFSAAKRLIIVAALIGEAAAAPPPSERTGEAVPAGSIDDPAGLSGDRSARGPAISWGLVAAAVYLMIYAASRIWRKWPAYLLGAPAFLVVLFFFFENFARLLPANY